MNPHLTLWKVGYIALNWAKLATATCHHRILSSPCLGGKHLQSELVACVGLWGKISEYLSRNTSPQGRQHCFCNCRVGFVKPDFSSCPPLQTQVIFPTSTSVCPKPSGFGCSPVVSENSLLLLCLLLDFLAKWPRAVSLPVLICLGSAPDPVTAAPCVGSFGDLQTPAWVLLCIPWSF